jgi:CHAT domain-containing protein
MGASIRGIQKGLAHSPGVLHFATHVVHSPGRNHSGYIVLSLRDNGQHEILGPAEIATWHVEGSVIALSGCSSGAAATLAGTGLMGLTRAWLTAGARAVVASLWPNPDDTGSIFLSFYRHLQARRGEGAALALRHAQMEMLRSNSWRSNPAYWASYFITGNQQ